MLSELLHADEFVQINEVNRGNQEYGSKMDGGFCDQRSER